MQKTINKEITAEFMGELCDHLDCQWFGDCGDECELYHCGLDFNEDGTFRCAQCIAEFGTE